MQRPERESTRRRNTRQTSPWLNHYVMANFFIDFPNLSLTMFGLVSFSKCQIFYDTVISHPIDFRGTYPTCSLSYQTYNSCKFLALQFSSSSLSVLPRTLTAALMVHCSRSILCLLLSVFLFSIIFYLSP